MNENYTQKLENILSIVSKKKKLHKLLLHSCCGPCSSYVLEYLSEYFNITLYYSNSNIDTKEEYLLRAENLKKLVDNLEVKNKVNLVIEEYDPLAYDKIVDGSSSEEGGIRCFKCYEFRMRNAIAYAKKKKFSYFTTTLSVSPHKNSDWINEIGSKLEKEIGVKFLYGDFKKKDGYKRSIELSNKYGLYRQAYCGCKYSKDEYLKRLSLENRKKENSIFKKEFIKPSLIFWMTVIFLAIAMIYGKKIIISDDISQLSIPKEINKAVINEIYIYGNHLNMKGELEIENEFDDAKIIFINVNTRFEIDLNYTVKEDKLYFYISDKLNNGYLLDNLIIGNYEILLELKKEDTAYYYDLSNETSYKNTEYYTITLSKTRKKINIISTDEDTMILSVIRSTEKNIYDVIIDPGHGGSDPGACRYGKCETDYTLHLSNYLKIKLEKAGLKVALTRYNDDDLDKYGVDGRVARTYKSKAKLMISIHLNASATVYSGFEIYTSTNIDYTFARNVIKNLNPVSSLSFSTNTFCKVEPGIYTRTFSNEDMENYKKESKEKNYEMYPSIGVHTNYYFMIREVGGYMTGAHIDGRDGMGANPYVDSNIGLESYILELGYIINKKDVELVDNYKEEYMSVLGDTIISYLNR